jgi:hypothetical protein
VTRHRAQRYISLNTLKTHLRAIIASSVSDGRQEAARRAVDAGIARPRGAERSIRAGQAMHERQLNAQVTELRQQPLQGPLVGKPPAEIGRIRPRRPHLQIIERPDEGAT